MTMNENRFRQKGSRNSCLILINCVNLFQVERTHYARDIGVDILNYFENYFEVEYPLPKQGMHQHDIIM